MMTSDDFLRLGVYFEYSQFGYRILFSTDGGESFYDGVTQSLPMYISDKTCIRLCTERAHAEVMKRRIAGTLRPVEEVFDDNSF